ncbi:hypothetical protein ACOI1C_15915 [Bacillus sp. DJP31]|uniref:hypothetical protein n=1 Tax=Bacillus sp. DJP31 TaxID=3409789 RepID=UPI003BB71C8D
MRKVCISLLFLTMISSSAIAANYTDSLLFKVTVWQNGMENEFEYENPSHYEWEKGSRVVKGEEAKVIVEKMYNQLRVSSSTKADQIKDSLEQNGFPGLKRFVVRWMDPKGNLYTWHWKKDETL